MESEILQEPDEGTPTLHCLFFPPMELGTPSCPKSLTLNAQMPVISTFDCLNHHFSMPRFLPPGHFIGQGAASDFPADSWAVEIQS